MRKQFVVTITPDERNRYRVSLAEIRLILYLNIESLNGTDRQEMWQRIRGLDEVIGMFSD